MLTLMVSGADEVEERARAAVRAALESARGPAGQAETLDQATEISLRRWRSFDRRSGRRRASADDRIEDLAKGLRDAFESNPRLVGPLMSEYRASARAVAQALDPDAPDRS
jgi:hypothetical protein